MSKHLYSLKLIKAGSKNRTQKHYFLWKKELLFKDAIPGWIWLPKGENQVKRSITFDFVVVYMHVLETSLEQKGALYSEQTWAGSFFFLYFVFVAANTIIKGACWDWIPGLFVPWIGYMWILLKEMSTKQIFGQLDYNAWTVLSF